VIDELQQRALALHRAGKSDAAAALHRQALALDANNVQSLAYLGLWRLHRREFAAARDCLEQAVALQAESGFLHGKLGACYEFAGQLPQALACYRQAIQLDPQDADACIHVGIVLQTLGRIRPAAAAFSIALQLRPALSKLPQSPSASAATRALVSGMIAAAQQQTRSVYQQVYEELDHGQGRESCRRFMQMLEIRLQQRDPQYTDPRQRPFESYMPGLPPQPWFERSDFSWSEELEAQSAAVAEEFSRSIADERELKPYVRGTKGGADWAGLHDSLQWSSLHLYDKGVAQDTALQRYPHAAAALARLPLVECAGHCPEAFFSILRAGTRLPAHYGQANYKLTAHLPLRIPPQCGITVGGETRHWVPGECLVFNDTFLHEAWNDSSQDRAVLIFEVWNPHVHEEEITAIQLLYQRLHRWLAGRRRMMMED